MPEQIYYLDWEEVNTDWEKTNMDWEDVYILIEANQAILGGGGYSEYVKGNPWNKLNKEIGKEKTEKFIRIFCRINDLDYEKTIEKKSKIKISISQFERVFQNIPNVKIKL